MESFSSTRTKGVPGLPADKRALLDKLQAVDLVHVDGSKQRQKLPPAFPHNSASQSWHSLVAHG